MMYPVETINQFFILPNKMQKIFARQGYENYFQNKDIMPEIVVATWFAGFEKTLKEYGVHLFKDKNKAFLNSELLINSQQFCQEQTIEFYNNKSDDPITNKLRKINKKQKKQGMNKEEREEFREKLIEMLSLNDFKSAKTHEMMVNNAMMYYQDTLTEAESKDQSTLFFLKELTKQVKEVLDWCYTEYTDEVEKNKQFEFPVDNLKVKSIYDLIEKYIFEKIILDIAYTACDWSEVQYSYAIKEYQKNKLIDYPIDSFYEYVDYHQYEEDDIKDDLLLALDVLKGNFSCNDIAHLGDNDIFIGAMKFISSEFISRMKNSMSSGIAATVLTSLCARNI